MKLGSMEGVRWAFNTRVWAPVKGDWMLALSSVQREEKERIGKFVFKKDAKSSMAGRLMLRKLASENLNLPWTEARFERTEKGRPYLTNTLPDHLKGMDFNVSHQGEWAVLAADGGCKVGVDVMKVEYAGGKSVPDFFHTMRRQFTDQEWAQIRSFPEEFEQLTSFYRHWCLKEGLVKALGVGIGFELRRVSFEVRTPSLQQGAMTLDTRVRIDGRLDENWQFQETMLDQHHSVAVALMTPSPQAPLAAPPFTVLCFDDLLANAENLTPPDPDTADAFMAKQETPWT